MYPVIFKTVIFIECTELYFNETDSNGLCVSILLKNMGWYLINIRWCENYEEIHIIHNIYITKFWFPALTFSLYIIFSQQCFILEKYSFQCSFMYQNWYKHFKLIESSPQLNLFKSCRKPCSTESPVSCHPSCTSIISVVNPYHNLFHSIIQTILSNILSCNFFQLQTSFIPFNLVNFTNYHNFSQNVLF